MASPPPLASHVAADDAMEVVPPFDLRPTAVIFNLGVETFHEAVFRLAVTGPALEGYWDIKDAGLIGSFLGYARPCVCVP